MNLELLGNQFCNWSENNLQVLSNKLFSDMDEEKNSIKLDSGKISNSICLFYFSEMYSNWFLVNCICFLNWINRAPKNRHWKLNKYGLPTVFPNWNANSRKYLSYSIRQNALSFQFVHFFQCGDVCVWDSKDFGWNWQFALVHILIGTSKGGRKPLKGSRAF